MSNILKFILYFQTINIKFIVYNHKNWKAKCEYTTNKMRDTLKQNNIKIIRQYYYYSKYIYHNTY